MSVTLGRSCYSCAEKCRRHTHWCRAGAEDALIGPVQNETRVSYLTCVGEAIRHNFIRLCPSINSYDDSFSMLKASFQAKNNVNTSYSCWSAISNAVNFFSSFHFSFMCLFCNYGSPIVCCFVFRDKDNRYRKSLSQL